MKQLRNTVIRAGLEALYFTGAHHPAAADLLPASAPFSCCTMCGRARDAAFQPNRHLEVTPDFLRAMLAHLRARGIDIVTMDEVHQRLIERDFSRRFACFTLDDGYRDNRDFALPVMREFDAPFTVYVASDFAARHRPAVVGRAGDGDRQGRRDRGRRSAASPTRLDTSTPAAKQAAFDRLHDWLRALPGEHDLQREIGALCARHGVDEAAICRELCMSWDELKPFAADPLVTIGAHTITHCNLAKQSEGDRAPRDDDRAARGSKTRCSARSSISPIPMATGTPPARANSRWRAPPASRPR